MVLIKDWILVVRSIARGVVSIILESSDRNNSRDLERPGAIKQRKARVGGTSVSLPEGGLQRVKTTRERVYYKQTRRTDERRGGREDGKEGEKRPIAKY